MNRNANLTSTSFLSICEKIFTKKMVIPRTWIRKKWYSTHGSRPQGEWDRVAELMMIKFGESGHPVFRATSPFVSRSAQKQRWWEVVNTLLCRWRTIETVFRTIISVNQLSIYRAVSDLCEECKACQVRTVRLVLARQSDPLFEPASLLTKKKNTYTFDR